jgi:hypothetical protein
MKKITKPASKEEAVYYSDFSGKCFDQYEAPAEMSFSFNYGSKYDTSKVTLHLTDEEAEEVLNFIKQKLSVDRIEQLKKALDIEQLKYDESTEFRDWSSCDRIVCNMNLLKKLTEDGE